MNISNYLRMRGGKAGQQRGTRKPFGGGDGHDHYIDVTMASQCIHVKLDSLNNTLNTGS